MLDGRVADLYTSQAGNVSTSFTVFRENFEFINMVVEQEFVGSKYINTVYELEFVGSKWSTMYWTVFHHFLFYSM